MGAEESLLQPSGPVVQFNTAGEWFKLLRDPGDEFCRKQVSLSNISSSTGGCTVPGFILATPNCSESCLRSEWLHAEYGKALDTKPVHATQCVQAMQCYLLLQLSSNWWQMLSKGHSVQYINQHRHLHQPIWGSQYASCRMWPQSLLKHHFLLVLTTIHTRNLIKGKAIRDIVTWWSNHPNQSLSRIQAITYSAHNYVKFFFRVNEIYPQFLKISCLHTDAQMDKTNSSTLPWHTIKAVI